jgi:DNA adenine methylase
MKPLVKWSGGKSREIEHFEKYIPDYDRYIEPFIGGGALYFNQEPDNAVINDVNYDLINFYRQIANGYGGYIYELMSKYSNTEDDYYYIRDEFEPSNDVERAFVFFYLRKTCYRGMLRYNKKGHFNVPFGRYKTYNYEILLDKRYYDLLKRTTIHNYSYDLIFDYYNSNDNFMFLDPPYDSAFSNYGMFEFQRDKHLELFNKFTSTNNKCLIVIGRTDFTYSLYKYYIVETYEKNYSFKIHSNRVNESAKHIVCVNY